MLSLEHLDLYDIQAPCLRPDWGHVDAGDREAPINWPSAKSITLILQKASLHSTANFACTHCVDKVRLKFTCTWENTAALLRVITFHDRGKDQIVSFFIIHIWRTWFFQGLRGQMWPDAEKLLLGISYTHYRTRLKFSAFRIVGSSVRTMISEY